jgi:tRNA (adenine22-N1)-methyltransferase
LKLSERLSKLHSYYKDSHSVWDIGCDHGQLGLSFGDVSSVQELHLVDPSSKVITELKKTVDSYITKKDFKVTIHEKRGQEVVLNSDSKLIYIAGMGGEEIKEILIHLATQLSPRDQIVISPHRKILELRKYLHHSAYRLQEEEVLFENGQYYQIMALTLGGTGEVVTSYGSSLFLKGVGPEYKAHQIHHFKQHKDPESEAYFAYLGTL